MKLNPNADVQLLNAEQMILIALVFTPIIALFVGYFLAIRIRFLRKFYCKIGWHCHSHQYQVVFKHYTTYYGGIPEIHTRCRYRCIWCGYEGDVDSQGTLY